ncbi:MAG: hypothetical protein EHM91_06850, partial [Planctomycetota bacterium]
MMEPTLQVALDFLELSRALGVAREAVKGGAQWIEAGTPLLKSEGLEAIRALRREFPKAYIIADTKTLDAGRTEFEAAAKAGANCATVCVTESDSTVLECIEAGRNYGIDVCVDLLGLKGDRLVEVAKRCQEWGAHHVGLHLPIDEQMRGLDVTAELRALRPQVDIPIAVAGGVNSETAPAMVKAGAQIVIVGGAITKSADAAGATRTILKAMKEGKGVASELFKRGSSDEEIRAMKLALQHKGNLHELGNVNEDVEVRQGISVGAVWTLWQVAQRVGLAQALGTSQQAKQALWQVFARVLEQGSRLSAVRLANAHVACDVLELNAFNEDDLYRNLDWL